MLAEADAHGPEAPRGEPGVVGADMLAEGAAGLLQDLPVRLVGGHRAEHHVGMTDHIFGAGEDGEIHARSDGREKKWRRPCIVRSEEHTSELQSLMRISYAVICLKKKN